MRGQKSAGDPGSEQTANANTILAHARSTVKAFDQAFEAVRRDRGVTQGAPTDEEQDLLRAALVLAAAGLDSLTKHLIRDTISLLLEVDDGVRGQLEKFIQKRIQGTSELDDRASGAKFLAKILAAPRSREELIEEYIVELTGTSLQSVDELFRAAKALGVDPTRAGVDAKTLRPVFDARNQIIHELDIDLEGRRRKRRQRTKKSMLRDAELLLSVGEGLIREVAAKLGTAGVPGE